MYYSTTYSSPVGTITLACDGNNLVGLWIEGQKYHGNTIFENIIDNVDLPILVTAKRWLNRYFAGKKPDISELPLAPAGSKFRQEVWNI
ncbi:methylated-DNA--[protein]-cysteine S-methyltransferase, partial [Sedimentibacter sp.]